MAKTDWQLGDVVQPSDMNQMGQEINDNAAAVEELRDEVRQAQINLKRTLSMGGML
jgi:hypothetical protein